MRVLSDPETARSPSARQLPRRHQSESRAAWQEAQVRWEIEIFPGVITVDRNTTACTMHAIVHRHTVLKCHYRELRLALPVCNCIRPRPSADRALWSIWGSLHFMNAIQFAVQHVGHLWYFISSAALAYLITPALLPMFC